jgi:hypothetical protein
MLLRSVFHAPNNRITRRFRAGYPTRRFSTLRLVQLKAHFQLAKIVRRPLGLLHRTRREILMMGVGLTVNVVAPANATSSSKLPVVVVCTLNVMLSYGLTVITDLAVDIWG